jgi:VanZ family protein
MNPVRFLQGRRTLNLALIILWMGAIFIGSSTPGSGIPGEIRVVSKVLHLLEYAILAFLLTPYVGSRKPLLAVVLLSTAYAASDEFHQWFVPGREAAVRDVVIDMAGSVVGAYTARRLLK